MHEFQKKGNGARPAISEPSSSPSRGLGPQRGVGDRPDQPRVERDAREIPPCCAEPLRNWASAICSRSMRQSPT